MTLSFCIPTYNRLSFLQKNISILLEQIKSEQLSLEVEICISDNHATDGTKEYCEKLLEEVREVNIIYQRHDDNLGPDRNFLSAMRMARGEYSILWGDDDFLHKGGLRRIFDLIAYSQRNDINIMVSSTNIVDVNGKTKFRKNFLRKDIEEYIVDFSNSIEVKSYFFLLKDMGGLLSFISDVIYKTSIIEEISFDDRFIGTNYAFLCYWWGYLAKGNKLYYSSIPFLDETVQYQPAYGYGVDRYMVDYHGYTMIADVLLKGSRIDSKDFLQAFQSMHSVLLSRMILLAEPSEFNARVIPKMKECGVEECEIREMYASCTLMNNLKSVFYNITPKPFIHFLKKKKKR